MLIKTSQSPDYYDDEAVFGLFPMGKPNLSFGDYDADGDLDVITHPSNFTQAPLLRSIYWENIDDTYFPTALSVKTEYMRHSVDGDFNNDGYSDSVLIDQGFELDGRTRLLGSTIKYVQGSDNGPVDTSDAISGMPMRMPLGSFNHIGASGDVDGDGDVDLLVAAFSYVDVYTNDGDGNFSHSSDQLIATDAQPDGDFFSLTALQYQYSGIGFIENAGVSTIVAGNYKTQEGEIKSINNIDVYQPDANGIYRIVQQLDKPLFESNNRYGAIEMHGSDINGDGRDDLLISLETEDDGLSDLALGVYIQNQNGDFVLDNEKSIPQFNNGKANNGLTFLDLNNDGFDDFFVDVHSIENVYESVWLNDRQGNFSLMNPNLLEIENLDWWEKPSLHWQDINFDGVIEAIWHEKIYRPVSENGSNGERLLVYSTQDIFHRDRLYLDDRSIAFDLTGSAGQTAKTLAAVIGEEGLSNKEYVGIGLQLFDAGQSLATVCELALTAVGATTNEDIVNLLYTNLYGEAPTADVAQPFIDALNNGGFTKGSLAAAAAELTDDLGVIDLVGLAETGIEYI